MQIYYVSAEMQILENLADILSADISAWISADYIGRFSYRSYSTYCDSVLLTLQQWSAINHASHTICPKTFCKSCLISPERSMARVVGRLYEYFRFSLRTCANRFGAIFFRSFLLAANPARLRAALHGQNRVRIQSAEPFEIHAF